MTTSPGCAENPFQTGIGDYLTVAEGLAVFDLAVRCGEAQVVVSTVPLDTRLERLPDEAATRAEPPAGGRSRGSPRPDLPVPYRAPGTGLERRLAELVAGMLGFDRIGADDDFFDLGGDSLVAVQTITEINRRLGLGLPPHALIDAPTVAALALRAATRNRRRLPGHFVPLRDGGTRPVIVLVHPLGGQTYIYRDLAARLPPGHPVLGIEAPLPARDAEPVRIEDRAAAYVEDLLGAVDGPYVLGGTSFGGVVAYEMSRQLAATGRPVPLTVMIDSPGPGLVPPLVDDDAWILSYLLTGRRPSDDQVAELRDLDPAVRIARVIAGRHRSSALPDVSTVAELQRRLALWRTNHRALIDYAPGPYAGARPVPGRRRTGRCQPHGRRRALARAGRRRLVRGLGGSRQPPHDELPRPTSTPRPALSRPP